MLAFRHGSHAPGFGDVFGSSATESQLHTLGLLLGEENVPNGITLGDARTLIAHTKKVQVARRVELREEMSNRPHDQPRYGAEAAC